MKQTKNMTKDELIGSVELLRSWIKDLKSRTPHQTVKDSCDEILEET